MDHPEYNSLEKISNSLTYELISIFGLYDTDKYNIKILCKKGNDNTINCNFFEIIIENQKSTFNFNNNLNLAFTISEDWSEKNCYFSKFISEKIFCCAIRSSKALKSGSALAMILRKIWFKYVSPRVVRIELASTFQPKKFCSSLGNAS